MRLFPKNIVVIPTIKVAEKTSQKGLFFPIAIAASARLPPTLSIPWSLSGSFTVIKVIEETKNKEELQKIVLCDVQEEIFPNLKNIFLSLIHNCGYENVTFDKEVNFKNLYNEKIGQK